jgi:D-alanine-D-alanine ligase
LTKAAPKKLRVLLLTDESLVPDKSRRELDGREAELSKTEYDVLDGLERLGHEVTCVGVGSELGVIGRAMDQAKPQIAFNLVEQFDGLPHFDQHVVSYLELRKQKYTGCNPRGLTIARDKALTKKILTYHRIAVPRFAVFPPRRRIAATSRLKFPLFVKSLTEEGSEGIAQASLVREPDKLLERIGFIHERTGSTALVEEFIEGREIYVGVFGNELLTALPPWELTMDNLPEGAPVIATDKAKWDPAYQRRMGVKSGPAELAKDRLARLVRHSKRIYRLLHLSGYARLDYRLHENGTFYLLEANPNPQIARDEDFANSAKHAGIGYEELLQKLLTLGLGFSRRV